MNTKDLQQTKDFLIVGSILGLITKIGERNEKRKVYK